MDLFSYLANKVKHWSSIRHQKNYLNTDFDLLSEPIDNIRDTIADNEGLLRVNKEIRNLSFFSLHWFFRREYKNYPKYLDIIQSLLVRMIKTSSIIDNLITRGHYTEAITLLRRNYEQSLFLVDAEKENKFELFETEFPKKRNNSDWK